MKARVTYFSASGRTAKLAKTIVGDGLNYVKCK